MAGDISGATEHYSKALGDRPASFRVRYELAEAILEVPHEGELPRRLRLEKETGSGDRD